MGSSTPNKVRVRFIILDGARAAWPVFCFLRVTKAACRLPAVCLPSARRLLAVCLLSACCLPVVCAAGNACLLSPAYWHRLSHCWVRRITCRSSHQHTSRPSAATHHPRVFPFVDIRIIKKQPLCPRYAASKANPKQPPLSSKTASITALPHRCARMSEATETVLSR